MRKVTTILSTALLALLLTSCCACRKGSPKIGNLEETSWQVSEALSAPVAPGALSLRFDKYTKQLLGEAPEGAFFANYAIQEGEHNVVIRELGGQAIRNPFVSSLRRVVRLKMEGQRLLMLDGEGNLVALLEPLARP